jgi:hypothetical protein
MADQLSAGCNLLVQETFDLFVGLRSERGARSFDVLYGLLGYIC